jgi:hypothetical protein
MDTRQTLRSGGGFGGMVGPPIPDLVVLVAVLFVTFALQFFPATAIPVALLRLSPGALGGGAFWQLLSYPFVGWGGPSLWFLLELMVLYWFSADVFRRLGRARFWRLLLLTSMGAGVATAATELVLRGGMGLRFQPAVFPLIQGQQVLLAVTTAAFGLLYSDAIVMLFFVLPLPARYFVWFPILFGFIGFLPTKDLSGLIGLGVAVLLAWLSLRRRRRPGGPSWWARLRLLWHEQRLRRLRRRSGLRVVDGNKPGRDLTIN